MSDQRPGTSGGGQRNDAGLFNPYTVRPRPNTVGFGVRQKSTMEDIQERVDRLSRASSLFEAKQFKLIRHIEEVRMKIIEEKQKRRRMGGVKACGIVHHNVQKSIRILENRLNKTNIRVCEIGASCEAERASINALRLEKMNFDRRYQKLQQMFENKKTQMADIIDKSNTAYEGREEALKMLQKLKEKEENDLREFQEEWSNLGGIVAEQAKASDYVKQSALKRKEKELTEAIERGDLDPEEEAKLRNKLSKLNAAVQKQANNIRNSEKNIQTYEEAFTRLKQATGIDDVNEIVAKFVENEDKNFGLFNYIQEVSNENDKLEDKLKSLEYEIEKYVQELGQNQNNRELIMRDMEDKLQKAQSQCKMYDEKNEMNTKIIDDLTDATDKLFLRVGCDKMKGLVGFRSNSEKSSPLCSQLGDRVEEKNIMLYLGVVEQRTNEIVQAFRKLRNDMNFDNLSSSGLPLPSAPSGISKVKIEPPKCNDIKDDFETELEDSETIVRPMTSEQLRGQTENPRLRDLQNQTFVTQ